MTPPDAAWERLAKLLFQRRAQISPRYANRSRFASERGIDYRLVYDIEKERRQNFGDAAISALEAAYQLAPGSIKRALDGGELEPAAPGPRPKSPGRFVSVPDTGGQFQNSSEVDARTADLVAAVLGPTIADLRAAIETARAVNPGAAGPDIFEDPVLAEVWDMTALSETDRLAPMAYYLLRKRREAENERKAV